MRSDWLCFEAHLVVFMGRDQQGLLIRIRHNCLDDFSIRLYLQETPRGLKFHCNNNCGEIAAWNLAGEEVSAVKCDVILVGSSQAGKLPGEMRKVAVYIQPTLSEGLFTFLCSADPAE